MLARGDAVPHFDVRTLQGEQFRYSSIWQRRNLVLVTLPDSPSGSVDRYISDLTARLEEIRDEQAECVITRDSVPGLPAAGMLVADRWGEIVYVASGAQAADLPPAQELLDWVAHIQTRCPECEGEAK
jgi:hypothetical protein